jgi:hypothetical protein
MTAAFGTGAEPVPSMSWPLVMSVVPGWSFMVRMIREIYLA